MERVSLIYGTANPGKLQFMKRCLEGLPITVEGLLEAAGKEELLLPDVAEEGENLLENARIKARTYYELFGRPVFSCDSGLYLWSHETGEMLPKGLQPGIRVRRKGEKRLTDEELIAHYTGLVKKYGPVEARYKNAICLIQGEGRFFESMDEALWGEPFLLADRPHQKRIPGFPLDCLSLEKETGRYYYDCEGHREDALAAGKGFFQFFTNFLNTADIRDH